MTPKTSASLITTLAFTGEFCLLLTVALLIGVAEAEGAGGLWLESLSPNLSLTLGDARKTSGFGLAIVVSLRDEPRIGVVMVAMVLLRVR